MKLAVRETEHCANSEPSSYAGAVARRIAIISILYLIGYLAASYLDLHTTALALQQPGTSEGNVYATNEDSYSSVRGWVITGLGALFIEGFLIYSLLTSRQVSQHCLHHPMRSFGKLYMLPWSKRVRDRSSLHMLSFVIAFVPLRLLAAGNNLLIHHYGTAPLGRLVGIASNHTSPTIGFWLVLGPLFYLLAIAFSPLAALVIKRFQEDAESDHVNNSSDRF